MNQLLSQIATPTSQSDYQSGRMDGTRFYGEGHTELFAKYETGSRDYRMGFDASKEEPRVIDPDYAS